MCQGFNNSANNWTVSNPVMVAACKEGTTNEFNLFARNNNVGACVSKIGCELLGGKMDKMVC